MTSESAERSEALKGVLFGVGTYLFWGVFPLYIKAVRVVAPLEILAHRITWSVVVLVAMVTVARRWPIVARALTKRTLRLLAISTVFITINWFVYIWSVTHNRVVEASLGYFILPLVSVLLGYLFLGERLRGREKLSVAIAAGAVVWLTATAGVVPVLSLVLATSFAFYGLVRKIAGVSSIEALLIETTLLLPLSAGYLVFREAAGTLAFLHQSRTLDLLLLAAGPVTAIPLLFFAAAVRRLRLATIGLLQYLSPTIQFTLAVTLFREPLGRERLIAFVLIWIAIAIYSTAGWRR